MMNDWMTQRPLDDSLAAAAGRLLVAIADFEREAAPLLRPTEYRTLEAARQIAYTLPGEEGHR